MNFVPLKAKKIFNRFQKTIEKIKLEQKQVARDLDKELSLKKITQIKKDIV